MTGSRRAIRGVLGVAAVTVLAALLLTLARGEAGKGMQFVGALPSQSPHPTTTTTTSAPTTTMIPEIEALIPLSVEALADDVAQSVAFVLSQQGTGSGVVISEDLVVTNAHVAWPDRTVSLVFRNGATYQGRVLALDPFVDLAVVDISRLSRKPPPISIGTTEDLEVGDELFVIGYPSPDEFTPEPTIDAGELLGFTDWEFTGVGWLTIEAPAIGGQSGGAVVDQYGRVVGISTFGSSASLTSVSIDDVLSEVDRMLNEADLRGLEPRLIPHAGARRTNQVSVEGEWDQQLLFGWFSADAEVSVNWAGVEGDLAATTIDGSTIGSSSDELKFVSLFAFPVVVTAEAAAAATGTVDSSLPLIAYADPDHGKTLARRGMTAGVFEVGGDRDFFYLELDSGESVAITVESASRTSLGVYGPDGGLLIEDTDFSGFIGNNAAVEFTAGETGRYTVAVESALSTVSGYMVVTQ